MITIIPAIDIIHGKTVRLTRGDFNSKKTYDVDPEDVAKSYQDAGINRLHLVDLEGAKNNKIVNWKVLQTITSSTTLQVDFGGGVQSDQDIQVAFDCGASQVVVGSMAVRDRGKVISWIKKYGSDRIVLGADVQNGKIAINAWEEKTKIGIFPFLQEYQTAGVRSLICTDIARDGLLDGPSFEIYRKIKAKYPEIFVIASGGVSSIEDIEKLNDDNIDGVIIGKALYEKKILLGEFKPFLC